MKHHRVCPGEVRKAIAELKKIVTESGCSITVIKKELEKRGKPYGDSPTRWLNGRRIPVTVGGLQNMQNFINDMKENTAVWRELSLNSKGDVSYVPLQESRGVCERFRNACDNADAPVRVLLEYTYNYCPAAPSMTLMYNWRRTGQENVRRTKRIHNNMCAVVEYIESIPPQALLKYEAERKEKEAEARRRRASRPQQRTIQDGQDIRDKLYVIASQYPQHTGIPASRLEKYIEHAQDPQRLYNTMRERVRQAGVRI